MPLQKAPKREDTGKSLLIKTLADSTKVVRQDQTLLLSWSERAGIYEGELLVDISLCARIWHHPSSSFITSLERDHGGLNWDSTRTLLSKLSFHCRSETGVVNLGVCSQGENKGGITLQFIWRFCQTSINYISRRFSPTSNIYIFHLKKIWTKLWALQARKCFSRRTRV